jgi:hypothetical protein
LKILHACQFAFVTAIALFHPNYTLVNDQNNQRSQFHRHLSNATGIFPEQHPPASTPSVVKRNEKSLPFEADDVFISRRHLWPLYSTVRNTLGCGKFPTSIDLIRQGTGSAEESTRSAKRKRLVNRWSNVMKFEKSLSTVLQLLHRKKSLADASFCLFTESIPAAR